MSGKILICDGLMGRIYCRGWAIGTIAIGESDCSRHAVSAGTPGRNRQERPSDHGVRRVNNGLIISAVDCHHNVLSNRPSIVVINDDRGGDGDALANTEEIQTFIDDAISPIDIARVRIARLRRD